MELTDNEKDMLNKYTEDYLHAQERANIFLAALNNLKRQSFYARGLSPETHKITNEFVIEEIKKDKPPE